MFKIEIKNEIGEWVQDGCWGGENATYENEIEAEKDMKFLTSIYDAEFRVTE